MSKVKVIGARVVIKQVEVEKTTASGLILPDKVAEENRAKQGTVVAVGDGAWVGGKKLPMSVKEGDVVIFRAFAGHPVEADGEEFIVINEGDILAVIE